MGQVMLEGCEMECQKIGIETRVRTRSETYFSNLATQLPDFAHEEYEDLKRSKASLLRNNEFLLELSALPSHYAPFVNHLFLSKKKFEDPLFPAQGNSIIWGAGQAENDWARIADMHESVAQIYKANSPPKPKPRVVEVIEMIERNLPGCLEKVRPTYLPKVGLAVCHLHINGSWEEVVIDDQIPTSHLRYFTASNGWYFMVEKALAKLLGCYAFVQEFTLSELFQEITGLPFEMSTRKGEGWLNRDSSVNLNDFNVNTFREVIEDERVCYLQGGVENSDVYNVRIIAGYSIRAFPFQTAAKSVSLFKITMERKEKVSIRVSYLNSKFETAQTPSSFIDCQIILYQLSNGTLTEEQKDNVTLGNNLYLGCPFRKLSEGEYILYVRRDSVSRRAALVCYAGEGFKIKEIQSKQTCNDLLMKLKKYERK